MSAIAERVRSERALALVVVASCCIAIAARRPSVASLLALACFGVAGLATPVAATAPASRARALAVIVAGIAAFALVRTAAPPMLQRATVLTVSANVAAGIAEEAVFRRVAYAWFARWGHLAAIGATSVLFAIVHVPLYGWGVLAIDLGAGVIFGWQRWASGTWIAPAITHVVANLIQMG